MVFQSLPKLLKKELTYFYDQIGKHITWQIDKYW